MKNNLKSKINIKHRYSLKKSMNLVKSDNETKGIKAIIYFLILVVFLILFSILFVIRPMNKITKAKYEYDRMNSLLNKLETDNSDYEEVREKFNELSDWYLDENETLEIDKYNVLVMLETDVMPYAEIESISISARDINIKVSCDNNYILADILNALSSDERILYAQINDTEMNIKKNQESLNAEGNEIKKVDASITIVYKSFSDNYDEEEMKGSDSDV